MKDEHARVRVAYFVPPSAHFAGIERVVHELATGLTERHGNVLDVHVIYCTSYEEEVLRDRRYTMHVLEVERLRSLVLKLRACVAAQGFDVLICPQIEASVVVWLATRGLPLPIFISHLHGNPRVEESHGSRRSRIAFTLFRHVVSRRISGILAVSPSLGKYASESVSRGAPVFYAKNPVRLLDNTENKETGNEQFRFLQVARLSHQKGQDILLRAFARALPDLPPSKLTLVGTGPDESKLKELSSDLGLDNFVEFAGYSANPTEEFRAADCFVLSSRWEGFGVVLLEALQFGLPLLASNCEFGPSDLISDPRLGDLVAPDSETALAEGMKRAARRIDSTTDQEFRRSVAQEFSRAEATKMHFEVLRQIVRAQRAKSGRLAALASA